jgi:ketosteroid isomerase-like protein
LSSENLDLVREIYDAVARGDAEAVFSLYDEDVEWDFTSSPLAVVFKQTVYRGTTGCESS